MMSEVDPNYIGEGLNEEEEIYKENILDHYKNPHNIGIIDPCSVCHRELNPTCGDQIQIFLEIDNKTVREVKFKGQGCAISQAAVSMLTDNLKGKSLEEVKNISREDILNMLGIPIGPVRMRCALLCLKTVSKAIVKWEEQNE